MATQRCLLLVLFFCAWMPYIYGRRLSQSTKASSSSPSPSSPPLEILTEEDDLEGVLKANLKEFGFSVARKDGEYPDVLLSLEVFNPGANADISCSPLKDTDTPQRYYWRSNNVQGVDYVFISTNSPYYAQAVADNANGVADFKCVLKHTSYADPIYLVEMTTSYNKRKMRKREQEAMQTIYETCCSEQDSCLGWKEQLHSVELEEKNSTREVTDFDFCHVAANVCDEEGYLLKLTMDRFGLKCQFPSEEIRKFEKLRKLSMTGNQLTGEIFAIAESLKKLKSLDEIALSYNRISGSLAAASKDPLVNPLCILSRLNLRHLHLQANSIRGPLPDCLFSEGSYLRDLILDKNPISSVIPDTIAKDSSLEVIKISGANLTGPFPETFVHANHLVLLDLSNNAMVGDLPDEFGPAPKMKNLFLNNNGFTGQIPAGIAASETLESIHLDHNAFDSMPEQWLKQGPKTPLVNLDVSFNQIEEDFPVVLSLLEHLSTLYMNDNKFHGPLPTLTDMFPNAWVLNMSNNAFAGMLPEEWTTLGMFKDTATQLAYTPPAMDLSYNQLTGRVPVFFFDIDNFPKKLLGSATVNLEGNEFVCPESGSSAHLLGFEHCDGDENPVFGESVFDVARNGGQPHPIRAEIPKVNQEVSTAGKEDSESSNSSSTSSSSADDGNTTWVIVVTIVSATLLLSVLVALAMRIKMYHLAKKAMASPGSDLEISTVKAEHLDTSEDLEQSKLRESVQNSDSNPQ